MGSLKFLPPSNFVVFEGYFLCYYLPLQDALYGLTFMLMNKHEKNDVSKDAPIVLSTEMAILSRDYNQELHCKF